MNKEKQLIEGIILLTDKSEIVFYQFGQDWTDENKERWIEENYNPSLENYMYYTGKTLPKLQINEAEPLYCNHAGCLNQFCDNPEHQ